MLSHSSHFIVSSFISRLLWVPSYTVCVQSEQRAFCSYADAFTQKPKHFSQIKVQTSSQSAQFIDTGSGDSAAMHRYPRAFDSSTQSRPAPVARHIHVSSCVLLLGRLTPHTHFSCSASTVKNTLVVDHQDMKGLSVRARGFTGPKQYLTGDVKNADTNFIVH